MPSNVTLTRLFRLSLCSPWLLAGTLALAQPPTNVSLSPSTGSGATQLFTSVTTDPNGYQSIDGVDILFDWTVWGNNACFIQYWAPQNQIVLLNDAGTQWSGAT